MREALFCVNMTSLFRDNPVDFECETMQNDASNLDFFEQFGLYLLTLYVLRL